MADTVHKDSMEVNPASVPNAINGVEALRILSKEGDIVAIGDRNPRCVHSRFCFQFIYHLMAVRSHAESSKRATCFPERNATSSRETNIYGKSILEPERKENVVKTSTVPSAVFEKSQADCEKLRARVLELQRHLQDAQDFIFSLQPLSQKLTETEASEDFNALCGSIEEWVDRKLGVSLENRVLTKQRVLPGKSKELLDLIPYPGKVAFKYPMTDEFNVTAAIMRFLYNEIFYVGFHPITKTDKEFIESVVRGMRNLEPRRGSFDCPFILRITRFYNM
jgi:hypothetical protein